MSQQCDAAGAWQDDFPCTDLCEAGECIALPSCTENLACAANESCCASREVPGGEFLRSYDSRDYPDAGYPATVSPFRLDRFEVTVERFRRWLEVYDLPGGRPARGSGKNVNNLDDPGWQAEWTAFLPKDAAAVEARFDQCLGEQAPTFRDVIAAPTLPVNCVDWYMALAFCIWDGGRLPTEAEWNFAAAGGDEQRVFPWSTTPPTSIEVSAKDAVFGGVAIAPVGSKSPRGDGRWGQADLAGNLYEWVYDWYQDPYPSTECQDCSNLGVSEARVRRGGSIRYGAGKLPASNRYDLHPDPLFSDSGFRCAR